MDFNVLDEHTFTFTLANSGSEQVFIADMLSDAIDVTNFAPFPPFFIESGISQPIEFTTTTVPVSGVTISIFWTCAGGSSDSYSFVVP